MAEKVKEKSAKLHEDIQRAIKLRKDKGITDAWNKVENVLDGDYAPLVEEGGYENSPQGYKPVRIKTHIMNTRIETISALTMPPPDMDFIVEPSNKDEAVDYNSALTAEALLDYYVEKCPDYEELDLCIQDYHALNRGIMYVGYKPDIAPGNENSSEYDDMTVGLPYEGEDKRWGQAFIQRVMRSNFFIAPGFRTIRNAEKTGGWVAWRVFLHKDWIKNNDKFNQKTRSKIEGDCKTPGIDVDDSKEDGVEFNRESENTTDYNFCEIYYIFQARSNKYPFGRTIAYSYKQDLILMDKKALPYEGIDFPFYEVIDIMPRKGDYAIPKTVRAINPMKTYEYYETKALKNVKDSKVMLPYSNTKMPDDFQGKVMFSDMGVVPFEVDAVAEVRNHIDAIPITIDNGPATEGSLRALSIFDEIMGPNFSDPRQKDKIATEMAQNYQLYTTKVNKHIVKINRWVNAIFTAKLTVTKEKVSPSEQQRMTRELSRYWSDTNKVTLKGNYIVTVKGSPLHDMTEGERNQQIQLVMQTLISIMTALPEYRKRFNLMRLIKEWVKGLDLSTAGLTQEVQKISQWEEIAQMISGVDVQVDVEDDDMQHMGTIETYWQQMEESKQQGISELEEKDIQRLARHYIQHEKQLAQKKQGAAGPKGTNMENQFRKAMGESIGNKGTIEGGMAT